MSDTISIPLSKSVRESAEATSRLYGFASLQDALVELVKRFSKREVKVEPSEKVIHLSKRNEKKYAKILKDMKVGKNVYHARDIDDFIQQLKNA